MAIMTSEELDDLYPDRARIQRAVRGYTSTETPEDIKQRERDFQAEKKQTESNERAEAAQALRDEKRRQDRIMDDAWERKSRNQITNNFLNTNSGMSYEEYINQQQNISVLAGKKRGTNNTLYHGLETSRGQLETVLNANRAIGQQRQKLRQATAADVPTGTFQSSAGYQPLTDKERNNRVTQILVDHRRLDRGGSYDQTAFNQLKDIGFTDAQARGFLTGPATRRGDDNILGYQPYGGTTGGACLR